jgi:integrase
LKAFELHLHGNSDSHIQHTLSRIRGFGFKSIEALASTTASDQVNKVLKPLGTSTRNHYLTAIKSFCRWAIKNKRLPDSPILSIEKRQVVDGRDRRAATDTEIKALLANIRGESYGLSPRQRYFLYQTALNTGLRAKELASLSGEAFTLKPTGKVRVRAGYTKNGQEALQPISPEFAKLIKPFLGSRDSGPLWPGHWFERAAEMLAVDLEAAEIPVSTPDGVLDFHALRVTYTTKLVRAGLHPRMVQMLARHSDINLTMKVYTKLGITDTTLSIGAVKPVSVPAPSGTSRVRSKRKKSA